MAAPTPDQRRTRGRVERLIAIAAPALNLVLAAGERLSRIVEPEDSEYYPVRSSITEGELAAGRAPAGERGGPRPRGDGPGPPPRPPARAPPGPAAAPRSVRVTRPHDEGRTAPLGARQLA